MVHPSVLSDPGLSSSKKRLIYIAAMMLAEDSGCLAWNARELRHTGLPLDGGMTDDEVQQFMQELEQDDYAWVYAVDRIQYAFLPAFPEWQSSLTRWNVPRSVPLPPGITFEAIESQNRYGSCRYQWPRSRAEMQAVHQGAHSSTHTSTHSSMHSLTQGAADSLQAGSAQPDCPDCGGTGLRKDGAPCRWCEKKCHNADHTPGGPA